MIERDADALGGTPEGLCTKCSTTPCVEHAAPKRRDTVKSLRAQLAEAQQEIATLTKRAEQAELGERHYSDQLDAAEQQRAALLAENADLKSPERLALGNSILADLKQRAETAEAERDAILGRMAQIKETGVTHELKTWPEFYDEIESGRKTFEIRENDRDFKAGDRVLLNEYAVGVGYSGRGALFLVTYVTDWRQQPRHVVLGLRDLRVRSTPRQEPT